MTNTTETPRDAALPLSVWVVETHRHSDGDEDAHDDCRLFRTKEAAIAAAEATQREDAEEWRNEEGEEGRKAEWQASARGDVSDAPVWHPAFDGSLWCLLSLIGPDGWQLAWVRTEIRMATVQG